MLLYSVIPNDIVMRQVDGISEYGGTFTDGGRIFECTCDGENQIINRLISTDPYDYLYPGNTPGQRLNINKKIQQMRR